MKTKPLYIVGFMVAIAAIFGGGVSGIYLGSAGILERNSAFLRQRALVDVFGLGGGDGRCRWIAVQNNRFKAED